jgi:Glycogen recognition site of AMP-activated protein kinase
MKTPIHSCHLKALGAPTFAKAAAPLRSCLRPCLTLCAPSAPSSSSDQASEENVGMTTTDSRLSPTPLSRHYSVNWTSHRVNFYCDAPKAECVMLVGDFNGWDPAATPMRRMPDGRWFVSLELHHGHHRYVFLVDGHPQLDPQGTGIARDDQNKRVSLIAVS